MKIAIVGAGEIGGFLAERFTAERFDVTVIDRDTDVLSRLRNTVDVAAVEGNATSLRDLQAAGIMDADVFIATTRQDETNLISCLLAAELKVPHTIAVTRYLGLRGVKQDQQSKALGIDLMVNSSEAVNDEIMELIETTGAAEVARFAGGRIVLVGVNLDVSSDLISRTVGELCAGDTGERRFTVASIVRGQELLEVEDAHVFKPGDYLYLLTTSRHLPELNSTLHVETIKTRDAVIYGDNFLSQLLANSLLNRHFHVTMLASTEQKAGQLREYFEKRHHFHVEVGSGMEVRLLRRVKVPQTSIFIAANRDDASNLTACMAAKYLGVGKTIATIKRTDLLVLSRKAGVDVNVAPRLATAKVIQKVVHENRVLDYRAVSQTNLEVVELEARIDSRVVRGPLKGLRLPRGVTVGAVAAGGEGGEAALTGPDTQIAPGDKVVVLTLPERLLEVEALFGY